MSDEKLVLCIKWGTMYGPEYVNVMYGMVSRNLSGPFLLICFTDDTNGIRSEVECLPLPELGVEVPAEAPGKWPKQALWAKDLFGLEGVALFLDLDSVIVDSINPYFEYGDADDVITARNWVKPWLKMAQTSVFRFKIGAHAYMLDQLREDPQLMVKYRFEQNYVSSCIQGGVKFWPGAWTQAFRHPLHGALAPALPARPETTQGHPYHYLSRKTQAADGRGGKVVRNRPGENPAGAFRVLPEKRRDFAQAESLQALPDAFALGRPTLETLTHGA